MEKIITLFLLFLSMHLNAYSQENFMSVLDSLSVKNKLNTKIEISSTDYFQLMKNKQNFYFLDKTVIYFSSYNEFSAFFMFGPSEIINSEKRLWDGGEIDLDHTSGLITNVYNKRLLLFDKKNETCYMIRYLDTGCSLVTYSDLALIELACKFSYNIRTIFKLDRNLMPESAISTRVIGKYEIRDSNDTSKNGDILGKSIYFRRGDDFISNANSLRDTGLNIHDFTYNDIFELLRRKADDVKNVKTGTFYHSTLKDIFSSSLR